MSTDRLVPVIIPQASVMLPDGVFVTRQDDECLAANLGNSESQKVVFGNDMATGKVGNG